MLQRVGIESTFSAGLRVTDDATMDVVEMVLGGGVNSSIVSLICKHGGRAVGLTGKDDRFLSARRLSEMPSKPPQTLPPAVDLGRVGQVEAVNPRIVDDLISAGMIPVVAPIGVDDEGHALNVNADLAAGKLASALKAEKLLLMTDVQGVKSADGELIRSLRAREAERLIESGVIAGGMIPKVRCALAAVDDHVEKAHIIDGRVRHALLLEILTDRGVGTEIRRIREDREVP
jgi:acetylglutamate kinase